MTDGDRRCLRFGLIAETAIQQLGAAWDATLPVHDRMEIATAKLRELSDPAAEPVADAAGSATA